MTVARDSRLDNINSAIITNPLCSGIWSVDAAELVLYYTDSDGIPRQLDFGNATTEELNQLAAACQPATFGLNKEDVLDETYRKAGKMDASQFVVRFNPTESGLLEAVRTSLLQGEARGEVVKAELYKLNVYGQGSFFKAHKDTPRSERMFGSLVLVLPAPHKGGSLAIRHQGQEWKFDSDTQLHDRSLPRIGYTAFFSDVEHEVLPVTSGYRITITYNLLHAEPRPSPPIAAASGNESTLLEALRVVHDPSFFPGGTSLGFGLLHQYPISTTPAKHRLHELKSQLKGTDAVLFRALESLNLNPKLYVVYRRKGKWSPASDFFLCSCFIDFSRLSDAMYADSDIDRKWITSAGGVLISCPDPILAETEHQKKIRYYEELGMEVPERALEESNYPHRHITWVSIPTGYNGAKESYVAYGNEAELAHVYVDVCLVVALDDVEGRIGSGMVPTERGKAWLEQEPIEDKARRELIKEKMIEKQRRIEEKGRWVSREEEEASGSDDDFY